jgi:hypothetical protein
MNTLDMLAKIQEFLDRTPITGAEAGEMVICQQWLQNTERGVREKLKAPSQVADTSGK